MAKIRLNKLPDGFEIKEGKVVKKMQQGGMMTGDQSQYALVTTPYNLIGDQFNNESTNDVRYSLSSVPREMANIEAEGGETVLTDLNNDGQFGLYNITGPRHSSGGVPMFLPEQSFVFSDTEKMKMNRQELAEFGIESRKKMTPAKVSKKFQLNQFIGAMRDIDADPIKVRSAELMIDKNSKSLSKLAFGQEAKKNFADGVPLASYPYLVAQGLDPIEFTQKVENITREQAAQRMFESMSPDQQAQVMALRQMMEQAGQTQQPQAAYGKELPKAQFGFNGGLSFGTTLNGTKPNPYGFGYQAPSLPTFNNDWDGDGIPNNIDAEPFGPLAEKSVADNTEEEKPKKKTPDNSKGKRNIAFDPATVEYYKTLGIDVNASGIGERAYVDKQPIEEGFEGAGYGDASKNVEGFVESWKGVYPESDALLTSIRNWKSKEPNPDVEKFQHWVNETYIPQEVEKIKSTITETGGTFTDDDAKTLQTKLLKDYGFNPETTGRDFDGDFGTFTSSRRPLSFKPKPPIPPETPKEGCPCKDGSYSKDCCPKPGDIPDPVPGPEAKFWMQDLTKMGALAMRDRDMFLPFQPAVEIPKSGYVLEEPTRQLADANEQLNIAGQAFGAFAGPQSLSARVSKAQGDTLTNNANIFAQVHQRNIGTVNRGKLVDAQLETAAKREQRDRTVKEYDDTQLTLQNYMDEKNLDREQMADLTANAYTNMANTYNLNTLYPYYNIDPQSGGMINITADLPTLVANQQAATQLSPFDEMSQRALNLKARGLDGTTINTILQNTYGGKPVSNAQGVDPNADVLRMIRESGMPAGYPTTTAKKGKEIKKYATPFYMGKIGY
jgi:hypothetical protein